MISITIGIYLILIYLLAYLFLAPNYKYKNFPPGPRKWPIVGSLPSVGNVGHLVFAQYAKIHGPVVGAKMGPNLAIYVHGAKVIKEAMTHPGFTAKFVREAGTFLVGDGAGIVQSEGEIWAEQRRFTMRHLRQFGFGKASMEEIIQEDVNDLIDWCKRQGPKNIVIQKRFSLAVLNSLWKIITGNRFHHDDSKLFEIFHELDSTIQTMMKFGSLKGTLMFFYPKVAKMFPNWSGWNKLREAGIPRRQLLTRVIKNHMETRVEGEPRDFVDSYLNEIYTTTDERSSFHPNVGLNSLESVMSDIFLAGNDTTAVALTWGILYLQHNPRVQKKLQEDLNRVVGESRMPCLADRKSLPYAEAVIMETLRKASVTPNNLVHMASRDVEFHGYSIPKGTHIFGNLYDCHHDPEVWGDPETFRPERFLNSDGTSIEKHKSLIPFSVGMRACIGEMFAKDSMFLFVTSLVHVFDICLPEGITPTLDIKYGQLTLAPLHSTVILKERRCLQ